MHRKGSKTCRAIEEEEGRRRRKKRSIKRRKGEKGSAREKRTSEALGVDLDLSGEPVIGESSVLLSLGNVVEDLFDMESESASRLSAFQRWLWRAWDRFDMVLREV